MKSTFFWTWNFMLLTLLNKMWLFQKLSESRKTLKCEWVLYLLPTSDPLQFNLKRPQLLQLLRKMPQCYELSVHMESTWIDHNWIFHFRLDFSFKDIHLIKICPLWPFLCSEDNKYNHTPPLSTESRSLPLPQDCLCYAVCLCIKFSVFPQC